jgi:flagellar hook-basal body complex protein FliE
VSAPQAIAAVAAIVEPSLAPSAVAPAVGSAQDSAFGQMVTHGVSQVNEQLVASQVDLQQVAAGAPVNLHQVMIGLEESRMSFELLMQVRNRLLEGYQDVMRMQV